jgi:hypothetical protein
MAGTGRVYFRAFSGAKAHSKGCCDGTAEARALLQTMVMILSNELGHASK